jgi:exodeoxyribonuclease-3
MVRTAEAGSREIGGTLYSEDEHHRLVFRADDGSNENGQPTVFVGCPFWFLPDGHVVAAALPGQRVPGWSRPMNSCIFLRATEARLGFGTCSCTSGPIDIPAPGVVIEVKIVTWNVNSIRVRLDQVLDWLSVNRPDVLCLQETKVMNENFPADELRAAGYHAIVNGQRTYNGVAILSRAPAEEVLNSFGHVDDEQKRTIAATIDGVRVINLYVPNGSEVGSEKYAYKLGWLAGMKEFLAAELKRFPRTVVVGDFNIAPEDRDVHDPVAWKDAVLCSAPERDALRALMALGLDDVFRRFDQEANTFSWWDYRAAAFRRNNGLRIDLVLASDALARECTACYVDKTPRTLERPSDHAPVVAQFS